MNIAEIRNKYPEYSDLTDDQLVGSLHDKYYQDMDMNDFSAKIGHKRQETKPELTPERAVGALKEGGKDVARNTLTGLGQILEKQADLMQGIEPEPQAPGFVGSLMPEGKEDIKSVQEAAASEALKTNPNFRLSSGFIEDLIRMTPQFASQMAASVVAGPTAGIAMMGLQITGSTYENLKAQGVDSDRALAAGLANAMMQAPLEQIGISKGLKWLKVSKPILQKLKSLAGVAGREWVTEFVQAVPEAITNIWATNPDKDLMRKTEIFLDNGMSMMKQGAYEGLIAATVSAGTFGLGGAINLQNKPAVEQAQNQPIQNLEIQRQAVLTNIQDRYASGQLSTDDLISIVNDADIQNLGIGDDLNALIIESKGNEPAVPKQQAEEPVIDLTEVIGREFAKQPAEPTMIEGTPLTPEDKMVVQPPSPDFIEQAKIRVGGKPGIEEKVPQPPTQEKTREYGSKLTEEERKAMIESSPATHETKTQRAVSKQAEAKKQIKEEVTVPAGEKSIVEQIFRGEGPTSKKTGQYWSPNEEWAAQFTQTGRTSELKRGQIKTTDIYDAGEGGRPYAGDPDIVDKAVEDARREGFKAIRLDEGLNEPPSIFVFDKTAIQEKNKKPVIKSVKLAKPKQEFKNYDEVQKAIDDLETKYFEKRMPSKDVNKDPDLNRLYDIRNKMDKLQTYY